MKKIAIIIVSYNKYADTIAYVNSLLNMNNVDMADIIIVDNCSTNDLCAILGNNNEKSNKDKRT
jgi:GT2 family glycosyltransferase